MVAYLLDSSAIVKRYLAETGSGWVRSISDVGSGFRIFIGEITGVEVVAAISRRRRGGSIDPATANSLIAQFRHEYVNHFEVFEVSEALIDRAMDLADKHELRGYDAVQMAAALDVQLRVLPVGTDLTVVSADAELNGAATAEGLKVEDPNLHP